MRVVLHRRRVLVEEYEVPTVVDATDADVMALCTDRAPVSSHYVDGAVYVYSRGPADIAAAGQRLAVARAEADRVLADAVTIARDAIANGASVRGTAEALGVDRGWLNARLNTPNLVPPNP